MATRPRSIFPLYVVQMWAVGDILGAVRDVETWAHATRLTKNPIVPLWRSIHAPIWNHHIERPVLVWDSTVGVAEETLAALREGRGDSVRPAAPTAARSRTRLADELRVSLLSLRDRSRDYDERRWKPGRMEPVADALWRAGDGYLDILDAQHAGELPADNC